VDQNFTADIPLLLHPTKIGEVSLGQKTASIIGRVTKIAEPTMAGSLQKRSLTLADETGAIPVTLWNSKAALNITVGDILIIHDGLLSEFGGLSISVSENTAIHLNPDDTMARELRSSAIVTTNKKVKVTATELKNLESSKWAVVEGTIKNVLLDQNFLRDGKLQVRVLLEDNSGKSILTVKDEECTTLLHLTAQEVTQTLAAGKEDELKESIASKVGTKIRAEVWRNSQQRFVVMHLDVVE